MNPGRSPNRRRDLARRTAALMLAVSTLASIDASAQTFPTRPIRVVIPIAPGASGDILLRQVTPKMSEYLGQPIVVENRTGGNGFIGTTAVTTAPADGYTLLFAFSQNIAVNPSLYEKLPYDPVKDLTGVGRVAAQPLVFVASRVIGAKSVADLVAHGKANPGKLSYASSGNGTSAHLGGAFFSSASGAGAVHVPYNSVPQALADLVRGEIAYMMYPYPGLAPVLRPDRVQVLAVTGPQRSPFLADVPTMVELGFAEFVVGPWYAFYAPAGTPADVVARLNAAVNHAISDPTILKQFAESGTDAWPSSVDEMNRFTVSEIERYRKIVRISGAKAL